MRVCSLVRQGMAKVEYRGEKRIYEAYIRLIASWYLTCILLRFSLNAAVTRPVSGVHNSDVKYTAPGNSNLCSLAVESKIILTFHQSKKFLHQQSRKSKSQAEDELLLEKKSGCVLSFVGNTKLILMHLKRTKHQC